jgi:hypothetical protein
MKKIGLIVLATIMMSPAAYAWDSSSFYSKPAGPVTSPLAPATAPTIAHADAASFGAPKGLGTTVVKWTAPTIRTINYTGFGTASILKHSFGRNVLLPTAVSLIVPDGWNVYADKGVYSGGKVSWNASNKPWTYSLRRVLNKQGLQAEVDWNAHYVLLKVLHKAVNPVYSNLGPSLNKDSAPAPALNTSLGSVTQVFTLKKGTLIAAGLKKWAALSGWVVLWQLPEDWEVPNNTVFTGSFHDAVTKVVKALRADGANIHVRFHADNKTVIIMGAGK